MPDYLVSVMLGIVEGLTEFLPVSSTAHLRITEALLRVDLSDGYWKMYTVVIQIGAILCLPIYFRSKITPLLVSFPRGPRGDRTVFTHPMSMVALAFIATAGPTLLMIRLIGRQLERAEVIGGALLVGGIVMWIVDAANAAAEAAGPARAGRIRTWSTGQMTPLQAVWIGLCQVLSAVFPGTSRSMATIVGGQLAGMSRAAAVEFSFLLSIPTMFAAVTYDLYKAWTGSNELGTLPVDSHGWAVLGTGLVVSFVVAYAAVAWFIAYVSKHGLVWFAAYRVALGVAVLASLAF